MTDDASMEAASDLAGSPLSAVPNFTLRRVPPPSAAERRACREAMERAIKYGAAPYKDADGKARYVLFKQANNAPVEAWRREPQAKRGFRRVQQARRAAGQLIGHPEDQIELAKRLGVINYREGRSVEGAAERGLFDGIWRYEHVWDSFTVPRRFGLDILETGRIAAVAEEEARRLRAEDLRAAGGFWVRDRRNNGLIYVVPNADPEMPIYDEEVTGGEGEDVLIGQAGTPASPPTPSMAVAPPPAQSPVVPPKASQAPATADEFFAQLRKDLAPIEGGYANRPKSVDRGGPTNKGVSTVLLDELHKKKPGKYRSYPTDTKNLTDLQIDTILREEIFNPMHLWEVGQIPGLPKTAPQLVGQLFDMGVLHGIDDPARVLQESLYEIMGIDLRVMKNGKLEYDGIIGPATRKALAQAVLSGKAVEINNLMVDKRLIKLNLQGEKVSNPGWFPRAESFRIVP